MDWGANICLVSMSLFPGRRIPSSVSGTPPCFRWTVLTFPDINSELDELDREEFYRLKKVAGKKQRDTAEQDAEMKARKEAQAAAADEQNQAPNAAADDAPADLLAAEEDEDVIF